jgi:hypothetical protein
LCIRLLSPVVGHAPKVQRINLIMLKIPLRYWNAELALNARGFLSHTTRLDEIANLVLPQALIDGKSPEGLVFAASRNGRNDTKFASEPFSAKPYQNAFGCLSTIE